MNEILTEYSLALQALMLIFATIMLQSLVAMMAHRKQKHYVPGVVDEKLGHESFVFRSHRTFMNSLENLPLLAGPAFIGILSGFDPFKLGAICWVYAIARIFHMVLYYAIATEKNPSPRSYFFSVALLVNVMLIVMVFIHVLGA